MCKLTKTYGQQNNDGSINTFNIDVDYDPKSDTVTEILYVTAYSSKGHYIDLTGVFGLELNDAIEFMVSKINWREEYRLQRPDRKAA